MPRTSQTVKAGTEIVLTAEQEAFIAAHVDTYQQAKIDYDLLGELLDTEVAAVKTLLDSLGLKKVVVEGVPCTVVGGTTPVFDKLKFVELGGSLEQLANATSSKPKRAHLRIGKLKEGETE